MGAPNRVPSARWLGAVVALAMSTPAPAQAASREDGFAVCITLVIPGMGAAYRGRPVTGALEFAGTAAGSYMMFAGALNEDDAMSNAGLYLFAASFIASFADAAIPAKEPFGSALPPGWRPAAPPAPRPAAAVPSTAPVSSRPPTLPAEAHTAPGEPLSVPCDPASAVEPVFIRTARAGLQQATPGVRVRVEMTTGATVTGMIVSASAQGVCVDDGAAKGFIEAASINQITRAK